MNKKTKKGIFLQAVLDILNSCILTKNVKIENLPSFDIEYLFLHVRAKSVGETIEVNITCPDDNETTVAVKVDIDSIKVKKNKKHSSIIKLDDQLSIKFNYPSMSSFIEENFETMPKLSHAIKVKNPKTEKESPVNLEGLAAFFN